MGSLTAQAQAYGRPSAGRLWLFSPSTDVAAFGLPALAALLLAMLAPVMHLPGDETPEWAWVGTVLLVDIAHVYGTLFRVYTDRAERQRRPMLYGGVPVACYLVAAVLYDYDFLLFWRAVAYTAVLHFIRQQIGWVRLYGKREGARAPWHGVLDQAAIYAATVFPLVWWHTHLPRNFAWMMQGDFVPWPGWLNFVAATMFVIIISMYALRMAHTLWQGRPRWGKDMVVGGTVACWVGGILANSDYVFTVTNVLIHGVPYMILIDRYRRHTAHKRQAAKRWPKHAFISLLLMLWALALMEEFLWDHTLWHERPWLFGESPNLEMWEAWLVPLLAVPQLTHYVLDGFVWRRADNPVLRGLL